MDLSKIPSHLQVNKLKNVNEFKKFYDDYIANGVFKKFEYRNYKCEIKRNPQLGSLCGYVYVDSNNLNIDDFVIHGGITYNDNTKIGFDCAHLYDFIPGLFNPFTSLFDCLYRDFKFVEEELCNLIDKIIGEPESIR